MTPQGRATGADETLLDLTEASDEALLRAHQCGDDGTAFGELFRRHRDRMWAVALRTTRDPELASDGVQDGFLNAYRRASSFRGEAQVSTWLHRVVVNACLDRLRQLKPTADIADHEPVEPRDHHSSVEARLDVRQALDQLPEAQRMALVLVDMHGLSVTEAAAVLECADGTVKSRCARGRRALAAILTQAAR